MNKLRFWAIVSLVLILATIITPLFGETYVALSLGLLSIFTLGMYVAHAEDGIHYHGRPVFW